MEGACCHPCFSLNEESSKIVLTRFGNLSCFDHCFCKSDRGKWNNVPKMLMPQSKNVLRCMAKQNKTKKNPERCNYAVCFRVGGYPRLSGWVHCNHITPSKWRGFFLAGTGKIWQKEKSEKAQAPAGSETEGASHKARERHLGAKGVPQMTPARKREFEF